MDNPVAEATDKTVGIIGRITEFDTDTKNNLLNGMQYLLICALPIALSTVLISHFFENQEHESKGTIELTVEILAQLVTTLLVVFIIHKIHYLIKFYFFCLFSYSQFQLN